MLPAATSSKETIRGPDSIPKTSALYLIVLGTFQGGFEILSTTCVAAVCGDRQSVQVVPAPAQRLPGSRPDHVADELLCGFGARYLDH